GMSENELQGIFPNQKEGMDEIYYKPDFDSLVKELRKPGVNLQLLWEEYVAEALHNGKVPYQLTQFKHYFNLHLNKITFTDIMHHKPGDQVEVDWAGTKVKYFDADTGMEVSGYLFVGCLPFSQYIYAEAFEDMKAAAFLTAHIHMFEYFGGVPKIIVCDNLKTGVLKHGANEDIILNPSYQNLAEHYGCVILPARVKKPKDKPSAEKSVDIATTWLIGKMRNMQCFSIAEYNESLFQNLEKINQKKFSKKPGSRSESFRTIEQEYLNPLPCNPFELCTWKVAKVQANAHIALERKYYSVPYQWIGKEVSLKITDDFIRIYANNQLLCEHSHLKG
ncbi:MAG: IS21 family transposase, partial [Erysipelotrichaceae bacterium]